MIVIIIASYMDDDDRIVYGWDFLVTQQEQQEQQQQQDKRVLGVRISSMMFAGEPVQSQGVEGERAGAAKADRGFEGFSLKSLFNNFKGFQ